MKLSAVALSLFLLNSVSAYQYIQPALVSYRKNLAVQTCKEYIASQVTYFGWTDPEGFCNVMNQPALGTMAHCLVDGFNGTDIQQSAINHFINTCSEFNLSDEQFDFAYNNATAFMVNVTAIPDFNATAIFHAPIKLSAFGVFATYQSKYYPAFNFNWTTWFSVALISYWFVVMLIAGACNLSYFLFPKMINKTFNGTISRAFRKYISLPALFGRTHINHKRFAFFVWMIPTRLESLLIFGWFILALAFQIAHVDRTPNLPVKKSVDMGSKVADRAGTTAVFLVPVNILFAGRNNFLQWVSGWSFSRMLVLHKYTSRITFLLVLTHAVAATCFALDKKTFLFAENWPRYGFVGLSGITLAFVHSISTLRSRNYELFILMHIIFAIIFIIGGWWHTKTVGFHQFFYIAVGIWAFDRLIRIVRLFHFGVRTASVQLIANETLRVTVPRPKHWKPFPGCHAFIHFLRPTCFWQSHPFTIIESNLDEVHSTITFCIKVKGGITHGLYQYLAMQPGQSANIKVMVEGPYGHRLPVDRFRNVIFLSGGNGIPGLYATAMDLIRRKTESGSTQRIKFYWVISHWKSMEWFYQELEAFKHPMIEPVIFITQPGSGFSVNEVPSSNGSEGEDQDEGSEKFEKPSAANLDFAAISSIQRLKNHFSYIDFREGRPDVESIVYEDIATADGTTCFVTCAHPAFVDHVRDAISRNLNTSRDRVDYFESIQNW